MAPASGRNADNLDDSNVEIIFNNDDIENYRHSLEAQENEAPPPPQEQSYQQRVHRRDNSQSTGPVCVDLDDVSFLGGGQIIDLDDDSIFGGSDDDEEEGFDSQGQFIKTPTGALMNRDVHNIPGSPWSKPQQKQSKRPTEPLTIAKYASTFAFMIALGWVIYLFVVAVWNYTSVGRIIIEIILAILAFFGLFWNSYFTVSSILKCFIPSYAFKKNTKYFSINPEPKDAKDEWLSVTIQIPVYKESLIEVIKPTLKSCVLAREHYERNCGAANDGTGTCNIVICDDGIMSYLQNNFSAAEMLWQNVVETKAKITNINTLLKRVPRAARRHLKGLRSKNITEVFQRMLLYYRYNIGFVARSTIDRRGKFKKASNINTHLRLVFGAQQLMEDGDDSNHGGTRGIGFEDALLQCSHNDDGSRYIMFGNDVRIGSLIIINDADARMSAPVIMKTVPEFLNDKTLGFTQHATKTMNEQRGESYFLKLIEIYTDALYQGHFLLSSILGCHPPLVGHSIFLRTEAVRQCGRMRSLRKAARWLQNIGLPFLSVDQVGFGNLQSAEHTEYWSENHVSEDFELMIHLYNLGYNGRYVAFKDCEFQEGVTRTFDEEAGRHRKFALGAHELMFNPLQDWVGHGIFTELFKNFLTCDIPSYYKIFLTAYLFSYTAGGSYIIVFTVAALFRIFDPQHGLTSLYAFSPAAIIILNIIVYYVIGYTTFLFALLRMKFCNNDLFFPEYRKRGPIFLIWKMCRFAMIFQIMFYTVMGNYFFLGSMDHLLSRPTICGATNKDSIFVSRCTALWDTIKFNSGSWFIAIALGALAYATFLSDTDCWTFWQSECYESWPEIKTILFAAPTIIMSIMALINPILLNPWIIGWPFFRQNRKEKKKQNEKKKQQKEQERKLMMKEQQRSSRKQQQYAQQYKSQQQRQSQQQRPSRQHEQQHHHQQQVTFKEASNHGNSGGGRHQSQNGDVNIVSPQTFMKKQMSNKSKPDVELGSLYTTDLQSNSPFGYTSSFDVTPKVNDSKKRHGGGGGEEDLFSYHNNPFHNKQQQQQQQHASRGKGSNKGKSTNRTNKENMANI